MCQTKLFCCNSATLDGDFSVTLKQVSCDCSLLVRHWIFTRRWFGVGARAPDGRGCGRTDADGSGIKSRTGLCLGVRRFNVPILGFVLGLVFILTFEGNRVRSGQKSGYSTFQNIVTAGNNPILRRTAPISTNQLWTAPWFSSRFFQTSEGEENSSR